MSTTMQTGTTGQPDYTAVQAWETAREAAEARGEAWVDAAGSLRALLKAASVQALRAEMPDEWSVRLVALTSDADREYTHRRSTLMSWGVKAWNLSATDPLPEEPWTEASR